MQQSVLSSARQVCDGIKSIRQGDVCAAQMFACDLSVKVIRGGK